MQLRGKTRSFLEQIKLVFRARLEVRITRFKAWQPNHLGMACCSLRILLSLLCLVIFNNSEIFQLFLVIFWVGLKTYQQHWVIYILTVLLWIIFFLFCAYYFLIWFAARINQENMWWEWCVGDIIFWYASTPGSSASSEVWLCDFGWRTQNKKPRCRDNIGM